MPSLAGITLEAPPAAPSSGPIPLRVTMVADLPTYYANNGILDRALTLICVRRDLPGVGFIALLDPHVIMLPESPLSPPAGDAGAGGYITEKREFDMLAYGGAHAGAAQYYVLAAFAQWVSEPVSLVVEDRRRRRPAGDLWPAPALSAAAAALPLPASGPALQVQLSGPPAPGVDGVVREADRPPRSEDDAQPPLFVTTVAVCLTRTGGAFAASHVLQPEPEPGARRARFSIPLRSLSPRLEPGRYRVLVFAGDQRAQPLDCVVPAGA